MEPQPPNTGRFRFSSHEFGAENHTVGLYDPDTRRVIGVTLPNPLGIDAGDDDDDPECLVPMGKAAEALSRHLDRLPPGAVSIELDEAGKLLSFDTDPAHVWGTGTDYPLLTEYRFPPPTAGKTVLRSELTEIRRLGYTADVVSYPPSMLPRRTKQDKNRFVFKYSPKDVGLMWTEIQILARLPPHPHLATLDRLVLDEITQSQVVGFTMRYIPNATLDNISSRPPVFKLKWLKQLTRTVDDLNLKHGIVHQDIADRNLLIDPATDSIVLIDFNCASRVGLRKHTIHDTEGESRGKDDVKCVLVFLYQYITRDTALAPPYNLLPEIDERRLQDPAKWVCHPSVKLDCDVAQFYETVMAWTTARRREKEKQLTHYTQAPEPLEWPTLAEIKKERGITRFSLADRRRQGLPYLEWERPSSVRLDPTRPLLATGRYADEEEAAQKRAEAQIQAQAQVVAAGKGGRGKIKRIGLPKREQVVADIIPWSPGQKNKAASLAGHRVLRPREKRKEGGGGGEVAPDNKPVKKARR